MMRKLPLICCLFLWSCQSGPAESDQGTIGQEKEVFYKETMECVRFEEGPDDGRLKLPAVSDQPSATTIFNIQSSIDNLQFPSPST